MNMMHVLGGTCRKNTVNMMCWVVQEGYNEHDVLGGTRRIQ